MNADDVRAFRARGYATRLRCLPRDEMVAVYDEVSELVRSPSPLFDHADLDKLRYTRNRHLDSATVLDLACHPRILDVMEAVLGPDLVLWRSDFFVQGKTDPETMWHQDRQFSGPRRLPSLVIPDAGGMAPDRPYLEDEMRGDVPIPISASVWLAISDTNRETGCVMVVEGSHSGVIPVRKARPGEKTIFSKATVLDYTIPEDKVRYMELEAGEFFAFDRLTLHASVATSSTAPRIGLSLRYTIPDVLIYPRYSVDGHGFSLENYRALLVRGGDRSRYNAARLEPAAQRRQQLRNA